MCIGKTISIFTYFGNSSPGIEKSFKYIDEIDVYNQHLKS